MITNERYPGLRIAVDYRLRAGLVKGIDPHLEPVAPGILSDDGYFKSAKDIARFQKVWDEFKPDPYSIVDSVSLDSSDSEFEYFTVYATKGRNSRGFDSPVTGWVSIFSRERGAGAWKGMSFAPIE